MNRFITTSLLVLLAGCLTGCQRYKVEVVVPVPRGSELERKVKRDIGMVQELPKPQPTAPGGNQVGSDKEWFDYYYPGDKSSSQRHRP